MPNLAHARAYSNSLNASIFIVFCGRSTTVSVNRYYLNNLKIARVLIYLRCFLDPLGQNSIILMFTHKSIVISMHKRVMLFIIFFTLNDLKQK